MTFDPTKPCVTRGGRYQVTILKVFDEPDRWADQIVGYYVDSDGDRQVETWCGNGRFQVKGDPGSLDLVNAEPLTPPFSHHNNVVHKAGPEFDLTYCFARSPEDAAHIVDALNAYRK